MRAQKKVILLATVMSWVLPCAGNQAAEKIFDR